MLKTSGKMNKAGRMVLNYFSKFKGLKRDTPFALPVPIDIILTFAGTFLGLAFLGTVTYYYNVPLLVAPLGASAVLVYGVPDAPLSQPRNVILGNTISAILGVLAYQTFGLNWWSVALGTSLALLVMLLTKTIHPPGGATALLAILSAATPIYIVAPVFLGSLAIVIIGVFINNLSPNRIYPRYWF